MPAELSSPVALVMPAGVVLVIFPPPPPPPLPLDGGRNGFPGETNGGLQKLNTDEPPGPVGVTGRGPGEAV